MKRATEILDYLKNKPHIIEEMETIWFVADIHHSHSKVIRIHNRPVSLSEEKLKLFSKDEQNFDNKEYREEISKEHTQWLIKDVVNKWVKKKHTVYFLGDLSFAPKIEAEKFIDRLNGNKFLIIGNHDKNIIKSTRFSQVTQRKNFSFKRDDININIVLDHYALLTWEKRFDGWWHLYGHVHGKLKNSKYAFDVGIDNPELLEYTGGIRRPLNLYDIVKIMAYREELFENNINYCPFY